MGRLALLLGAVAALALAASCGGEAVEPQPTPGSTRAERAETVVEQQAEETVAAVADRRAGVAAARNVVGDPDAPVLIVEYSDFQ